MYYSSGIFEAHARPRKPVGVDDKRAWLVGSGIASLAAAAFLLRDGHMKGEQITILEASAAHGGALDGSGNAETGWLIRGGRELEDHYECMWDLYRSVPSLEVNGSALDEFFWINKDDPNSSLRRTTKNQGEDGGTDEKFGLSDKAAKDIVKLVMALPEDPKRAAVGICGARSPPRTPRSAIPTSSARASKNRSGNRPRSPLPMTASARTSKRSPSATPTRAVS